MNRHKAKGSGLSGAVGMVVAIISISFLFSMVAGGVVGTAAFFFGGAALILARLGKCHSPSACTTRLIQQRR